MRLKIWSFLPPIAFNWVWSYSIIKDKESEQRKRCYGERRWKEVKKTEIQGGSEEKGSNLNNQTQKVHAFRFTFPGKNFYLFFFFFFLSCFFSTVSMEIMVIYISNKKKRSLSLSLSLSLLHPPLHDFKAVGTGWEIQVNYNENFILRFIKLK